MHDTLARRNDTSSVMCSLRSGAVGFLIAVKEAGHARKGQREEHAIYVLAIVIWPWLMGAADHTGRRVDGSNITD
jgi:hypothetical protein